MVCEKLGSVEHDFTKDPLQLEIDGDMIRAKGTTLGADNGIAVAFMLAVLDSTTLEPVSYTHLDVYKRQRRNNNMAYVAVSGGEEAIAASIALLDFYRSKTEKDVELEVIQEKMSLLVDRVMSEAGLYAKEYAALALKPVSYTHLRPWRQNRASVFRSLLRCRLP